MGDEYVSYKTPSTIISETVYHFLRGSIYGAAYGLVRKIHSLSLSFCAGCVIWTGILQFPITNQVTPFHAPGSPGAILGKSRHTRSVDHCSIPIPFGCSRLFLSFAPCTPSFMACPVPHNLPKRPKREYSNQHLPLVPYPRYHRMPLFLDPYWRCNDLDVKLPNIFGVPKILGMISLGVPWPIPFIKMSLFDMLFGTIELSAEVLYWRYFSLIGPSSDKMSCHVVTAHGQFYFYTF